MNVVLFEDVLTSENRPATLARAAFALSLAATRLYDVARAAGGGVSAVVRRYLRDITEAGFALDPLPKEKVLFVNASLVPSFDVFDGVVKAAEHGDFIVESGARVAAAYVAKPSFDLSTLEAATIGDRLKGLGLRRLDNAPPLVTLPCDIVRYHQKYFHSNIERLIVGRRETQAGVFAGEGVKVHPTAVLDSSDGAIVLENGVSVGPFALIIGPSIVGRNTRIIERATIKEEVQISHTCKIGGEVEASSIEAYTNKQHHGFCGHSWLGSWINLGAGTSNSDLKNTYGEITLQHRGEKISTGMQFLGCVMGDWSKSAINTSIFTGKLIGVASFLYGFVGTNVPSFTNYARSFGQQTECLLESVVKTQERVFARRNVKQTPADVKLLEDLYEITRDERLMSTDQVMF